MIIYFQFHSGSKQYKTVTMFTGTKMNKTKAIYLISEYFDYLSDQNSCFAFFEHLNWIMEMGWSQKIHFRIWNNSFCDIFFQPSQKFYCSAVKMYCKMLLLVQLLKIIDKTFCFIWNILLFFDAIWLNSTWIIVKNEGNELK